MRWLLLLACVAAQPALPLLPSGVTMDKVTRIDVYAPGATVGLLQADPGTDATITNRLSATPVIKFDQATGTLTVTVTSASGSSMLKPGLFAAFLAVALCAFQSKGKNTPFLMCLLLCLGVANAGMVMEDVILRIPGCWHPENNGTSAVFDLQCANSTMASFQAPANPVPTVKSGAEWKPVDPTIDSPKHSMPEEFQYEVWRSMYGRVDDPATHDAFVNFTRNCQKLNAMPDRTWLAACNHFAGMTPADWATTILRDNEQQLSAFHANVGRRLLESLYVEETHRSLASQENAELHALGRKLLSVDSDYASVGRRLLEEDTRRKLLQAPASFSWVGTGKLTPVKDQGQCGSCYAHSTSSQMEAQMAIEKGTVPVALSREQLKECSSGSPGCGGGVPAYMYNYAAATAGLGTEAALGYNAYDTTCPNPVPSSSYKNTGYKTIANNEAAFKLAVQTAPVAVTVCASSWSSYSGGVFSGCSTGCAVNHAVLLVGYGTDPTYGKYWLIQNSWNTWWGESGFIRMPRTDSSVNGVGMCGLTTYAGYQAAGISGGSNTGTPCQGSWSAWSQCSQTCGSGTQTKTWTTTAQPSGGGTPCPNPTTMSQSCNTALCPTPGGGGATTTCLHLSGTVLGSSGDGDYKAVAPWNENFCGTAPLPQYYSKDGSQVLFFFVTNCVNGVRTAGMWGFGPVSVPGAAYQWATKQSIVGGEIPAPNKATGWTIAISQGTTCV